MKAAYTITIGIFGSLQFPASDRRFGYQAPFRDFTK